MSVMTEVLDNCPNCGDENVDGWDYDASHNRVKFYGAACEALQQGQIDDVAIVFGCPPDAPK